MTTSYDEFTKARGALAAFDAELKTRHPAEAYLSPMHTVRHTMLHLMGALNGARFEHHSKGYERLDWLTGVMSPTLAEHALRIERVIDGSLLTVGRNGNVLQADGDPAEYWMDVCCKSGTTIERFARRLDQFIPAGAANRLVWHDLGPTIIRIGTLVRDWEDGRSDSLITHQLLWSASELFIWAIIYMDAKRDFPLRDSASWSVLEHLRVRLEHRLAELRRRNA